MASGRSASPLLILSFFFFFFFFFVVVSSASDLSISSPQELRSFNIQEIKKGEENVRGYCTYKVKIKTSCYSPKYTRDAISLAFGDLYRNEVYVARINDPSTYAFERCSTDTYQLQGPCGYGVCYLYLYRYGYDGWTPDTVKIYEPNGRTITFYYGTPVPYGVWFGFNQCPRFSANDM